MAGNKKETTKSTMAEFDFEELSEDVKFVTTAKELDEHINKIEKQVDTALKLRENSHLSLDDTIKLDNYLAFAANTLYWMYLKLQGADHKMHLANGEIARSRTTIVRDNDIEANDGAPRLDVPAARRFIGHGTSTRFKDTEEAPVAKNENPDGKTLSLQEKPIEQRKETVAQQPPPSLP